MSEFVENEYGDDGNEDWSDWQAAYDTSPVEATAALAASYAQQAAAAYAQDPSAVAAEALGMMQQLQYNAAQQRAAEAEASTLDRSMAAEYGSEWVNHSHDVAQRLATDEELQAKWDKAKDSQARLDILDAEFQAIREQERTKTFRAIQSAPSNKLGL